jgi:hypothetical protein
MNIDSPKSCRNRPQQGSAVLVLTIFISTMLLMVAATTQSRIWLRTEINLIEKRQVERLQRLSAENTRASARPATSSSAP